MNKQLQRIRRNHAKILNGNKEQLAHVFGAGRHKFMLQPVVSAAEVRGYEQKHEFECPEDYRNFLINIGNGGAGPFYGIHGLHSSHHNCEARLYKERSFIHHNIQNEEGIVWQEVMLGKNWEERAEENEDLYYYGHMTLAEVGCGTDLHVIVNGPCRGKIFCTDFYASAPEFCQPSTFLDYYEIWQESCITGVPSASCIFMTFVTYDFSRRRSI